MVERVWVLLNLEDWVSQRCRSGAYILVWYQYWVLTKTSLRYPDVALSHEDPMAIVPQETSLHCTLEGHRWYRCWWLPVQSTEKRETWVVVELVSRSLHWSHLLQSRGRASSPEITSWNQFSYKGKDQLFQVQGQISHEGRARSPRAVKGRSQLF